MHNVNCEISFYPLSCFRFWFRLALWPLRTVRRKLRDWEVLVNPGVKAAVFWLVILFSAFLLWQVVRNSPNQQTTPEISYSEFLSQVEAGNVARVTIANSQVDGTYRDNRSFRVTAPTAQEGMLQTLRQKNVEVWFRDAARGDWPSWLLNLAPLVLLAALWFFMLRQMKSRQVQTQTDAMTPGSDSRWPGK